MTATSARLFLSAAALATVAATPAATQVTPAAATTPTVTSTTLPSSEGVNAFYDRWRSSIWFKGGAVSPAAAKLVTILRRGPIEGVGFGPAMADQVEAAVSQASSGTAADVAAAERVLSSAWVQYVQTIKRPTPRMIYAYPNLSPQGTRADQILLSASAAPALDLHLQSVSNINPFYSSIRDAAFAQAQASGNVTADARLLANLERARSLPSGGRFAVVDSATQRLTMYENGQAVDSMKVVVGDKDKLGLPTPLIASYMHYITFNPYWNVPHHLVRKTVAPGVIAGGVKFLNSKGYEVLSDWTETATVVDPTTVDWKAVKAGTTQVRVRKKPGADNSMGKMKFPFPNGEDIFLHDTPTREHFAKAQRTISNGCVRLEDARRFAKWLMRGQEPVVGSEIEQRVQLPQGVPIYLTYLTAQPTTAGLTYLKDVYGWDQPATQVAAAEASATAAK